MSVLIEGEPGSSQGVIISTSCTAGAAPRLRPPKEASVNGEEDVGPVSPSTVSDEQEQETQSEGMKRVFSDTKEKISVCVMSHRNQAVQNQRLLGFDENYRKHCLWIKKEDLKIHEFTKGMVTGTLVRVVLLE